jgi:hypothetical protein
MAAIIFELLLTSFGFMLHPLKPNKQEPSTSGIITGWRSSKRHFLLLFGGRLLPS